MGPQGSGKPIQPEPLIALDVLRNGLIAAEHPFPEPDGNDPAHPCSGEQRTGNVCAGQ